ncbi:MAG: 2-hydroxyacid dehydrogenase [Spirochaetaceae bacterium]|jgi:D-lactate dehydrogenase|nr:2-hydroxyacid dehydrogenase [Spirochaetaceae bacterium]
MSEVRIAFFDAKPYDKKSFDKANEKFGFAITYLEARLDARSAELAHGADAVCAFVNDRVDAEAAAILEHGGIKLVALRCAGYNNIDLKAVWQKIHVVRVPAYSPYAVAEHAAALLLTLTRHIHQAYNRVREGNFLLNGLIGRDLHDKYIGIVGTGKIGKIASAIFRGFGMRVLAYDKFPDEAWAKNTGAVYVPLEELCEKSDVISLHSPLTPETRHLINERLLSLMKHDVVIINTGRGALIDTKALVTALKKGHIGGAGLDVYEEEEGYFFEDWSAVAIKDDVLARLLTFPNVIITGHQAFFTSEALGAIADTTLANIKGYFEQNALPNEICYQCGGKEGGQSCAKEKSGRCW